MKEWIQNNIDEDIIEGFNNTDVILLADDLTEDEKKIAFLIAERIYITSFNEEPAKIYDAYENGTSKIRSGRIALSGPDEDILFRDFGQQIGIIISEDLLSTKHWRTWCAVTKAAITCAIGDVTIIDNMLNIKNSIGWDSII